MSKPKGHYNKKNKSRRNAKSSKSDSALIREHGKLWYDLHYGVDRSDLGTGGGVQTPKHDADSQHYDWRDHEGDY